MENIYNHLFNLRGFDESNLHVLNEMYYGKHPYFKIIEQCFAKIQKILIPYTRTSGLGSHSVQENYKTYLFREDREDNGKLRMSDYETGKIRKDQYDSSKKLENNFDYLDPHMSDYDNNYGMKSKYKLSKKSEDDFKLGEKSAIPDSKFLIKKLEPIVLNMPQKEKELNRQTFELINGQKSSGISDEEITDYLINYAMNTVYSSENNNYLTKKIKLQLAEILEKLKKKFSYPIIEYYRKSIHLNDNYKKIIQGVFNKKFDKNFWIIGTTEEDREKISLYLNEICACFQKVFKFPKLTIDIMKSYMYNAMYFSLDAPIFDKQNKWINKASNPIAVRDWFNKSRIKMIGSEQDSLYYKKSRDISHIFITHLMIEDFSPSKIVAVLLHEIGHYFGFKLLPVEYFENIKIQEKFADAFAVKFGYGKELASALRYLSAHHYEDNLEAIVYQYKLADEKMPADNILFNKRLDPYLKIKLLMPAILDKIKIYDPHPLALDRQYDILKNAMIELNNPRLNNLQRKQLENDIRAIRKELKDIDTGNSSIGNFDNISRISDKAMLKMPLYRAEEMQLKTKINEKIIRDLLDKIYDNSMGNV